jgi:hypothetical protein
VGDNPNPAEVVRAFLRWIILHRNVPSSGSSALQINLSRPIGPSKTVPGPFSQDAAGPRVVKDVRISLFSLVFTQVFTLWPRTPLKENTMPESKPRKQRPENNQNGREDPTFSAFSRPKSSWGRSRPLQQDATVAMSRPQAKAPNSTKTRIAKGSVQSDEPEVEIIFVSKRHKFLSQH